MSASFIMDNKTVHQISIKFYVKNEIKCMDTVTMPQKCSGKLALSKTNV